MPSIAKGSGTLIARFPKGVPPFELLGYRGTIVLSQATDGRTLFGKRTENRAVNKYVAFALDRRRTLPWASVRSFAASNPLSSAPGTALAIQMFTDGDPDRGACTIVYLRKVRGEWYVVGTEEWIVD